MKRNNFLQQATDRTEPWDMIVIGGGATGIGIAMDAAVRGLSVLLLEQSDFGKGTSSRSTKLIHGGVRYLKQGNVSLVRDSLRERARLQQNAPHLVTDLAFLVPCQSLWERLMYRVGFVIYDFLAGKSSFGKAKGVSKPDCNALVSTIRSEKMHRGGVVYHDGQFDDSRLLVHMAQTSSAHGGCLLNYTQVTKLVRDGQRVSGVEFIDLESETKHTVNARCVINATGPFCDAIRQMDDPSAQSIIRPSQGVHVVLPREFLPGDTALIVPKTSDGRVLFLIPWHDHVVVGTTDTAIDDVPLEPTAQSDEVKFLLKTTADYLIKAPTADDVLSMFIGIRPLVSAGNSKSTKSLSRDHTIELSKNGLITITGGKWTTVRKMAEDCVNRAIQEFGLSDNGKSTVDCAMHGAGPIQDAAPALSIYGSEAPAIEALVAENIELGNPLHPALSIIGAQVVWAVRNELARTVEDVLARRTRALFLNVEAAIEMAPIVAKLMAKELGKDDQWQSSQVNNFNETAKHFQCPTT